MPNSSLAYRDVLLTDAPPETTVIALHGNRGHLDDVVPLAQSILANAHVVAPQAARGIYEFRTLVSHSWYGGMQIDRPEPASFGDSLSQLERFIHDVRERNAGDGHIRPWLLGYDQGAVLALSIAAIVPDLVRGVMAVCGGLPTFSNPELMEFVASDLPVLLIGDDEDRAAHAPMIDATAAQLEALGNHLTVRWVSRAAELGTPVSEELRAWLHDHRAERG